MTDPALAPRSTVAVVFGGRSTEHAISCVSAASVLEAVDRTRFDVVPVGITEQGRWVLAPDDPEPLRIVDGRLPQVDAGGTPVTWSTDPAQPGLLLLDGSGQRIAVDVVFPILHGPYGEDGTVQGLFETAGLPYVGSGVLASAVAMDKAAMKVALDAAGLPGVAYEVVTAADWHADEAAVLKRCAALGFPLFVKPARGGSSIGISKVSDPDGLPAAIAEARRHDPKLVVEAAAVGREIECGVLEGTVDDAPPEASLPSEIHVVGDHDFYDFTAKYLDGATRLDVPADLPDDVTARVRAEAVRAFTALGCEGLARVDFFVGDDGTLLVNEVNTMPGFTPASMFPRMWDATGLDYRALVDRLLTTALRRRPGLR